MQSITECRKVGHADDPALQAIRARCLAAFDLDPNTTQPLAFGARTHLRLRVAVYSVSGASTGSTIPPLPDNDDVRAVMQVAQDEALDEELFGEVRVLFPDGTGSSSSHFE